MIWYSFLSEVKARSFYFLLSFLLTLGVILFYKTEVFFLWLSPFSVFENTKPRALLCMDLSEPMTIQLWIYLVSSFLFIFPFYCFQCFAFLSPSFYRKDWKKWLVTFTWFLVTLYSSWSFSYIILFPKICMFLFQFEQKKALIPIILEPRISSFFSFFLNTLVFQFVFFVGFFLLIRFISMRRVEVFRYRRIFAFSILFLAAWFSPPDVFSQVAIMITFFAIYELLILYAFFVEQKFLWKI